LTISVKNTNRYKKMTSLVTFIVTKNSMRQNGGDCDAIGCDVTCVRSSPEILENINRCDKMVALTNKCWRHHCWQNFYRCDVTGCDVMTPLPLPEK